MPRHTKADIVAENERLTAELAESREGHLRLIDQLQALGEEFGCPAGMNRIQWLRHKLRRSK